MSIENNKVNTRRVLEEIWNQGDVSGFEKLCVSTYTHHDSSLSTVQTQADLKRWVTEIHSAFTGLRFTIEDLFAEGEEVMARWMLHGKHTGNLVKPMHIPATGKQITVMGITIVRFNGGKIVEDWNQLDYFSLFQQLGAFSTLQPAR